MLTKSSVTPNLWWEDGGWRQENHCKFANYLGVRGRKNSRETMPQSRQKARTDGWAFPLTSAHVSWHIGSYIYAHECVSHKSMWHTHTHKHKLMWEMIIKLDSASYGPESISRMCHMFISSRILGYEGTAILKHSRREKCFVNFGYGF